MRPGEHGQTQVDGGRTRAQSQVADVQGSGETDEGVSDIQAPVALLVGVQHPAPGCHAAAQSHVIEFVPVQARRQTSISRKLSQLGKSQTEELVALKDLTGCL